MPEYVVISQQAIKFVERSFTRLWMLQIDDEKKKDLSDNVTNVNPFFAHRFLLTLIISKIFFSLLLLNVFVRFLLSSWCTEIIVFAIQTATDVRPAERKRKTKFNDSSFVTSVRMVKTKQKSLAFFSFVRRHQFVYLKYQKISQWQSTTFHMSYLDKCQSQDHISCSVQDVLDRKWAKTFATNVNFVGSFITWQYWSALQYTRDRRATHSSFSEFWLTFET